MFVSGSFWKDLARRQFPDLTPSGRFLYGSSKHPPLNTTVHKYKLQKVFVIGRGRLPIYETYHLRKLWSVLSTYSLDRLLYDYW
jgi:hypothetical protein